MLDFSQILAAFIGVVGGLIGGYMIEHYRLKHELKIEKIKRLAPHLEQAYPAVRELCVDSQYALELQQRDGVELPLVTKLCVELTEFKSWYLAFRRNGMEPELESLDANLYRLLLGIFVYSQLSQKHGADYVSTRLDRFHHNCLAGRKSLEKLLMG